MINPVQAQGAPQKKAIESLPELAKDVVGISPKKEIPSSSSIDSAKALAVLEKTVAPAIVSVSEETPHSLLVKFQEDLQNLAQNPPTHPADFFAVINNPLYSDKVLGQTRLIGLMSVAFDKTIQDSWLINALVQQLIPYASGDHDTLFIASIARNIATLAGTLDRDSLQAILTQLPAIDRQEPEVSQAVAILEQSLSELPNIQTVLSPQTSGGATSSITLQLKPESLLSPPSVTPLRNASPATDNDRLSTIRQQGVQLSPLAQKLSHDVRTTSESSLTPSAAIMPADNAFIPTDMATLDTQLAIVTTPSASLPETLLSHTGIKVVPGDMSQYLQGFTDIFQHLLQAGFPRIYAILPDAEYWHACHYAKHASYKLETQIKVIDSKTFGIGLRLLIEHLVSQFEHGHSVLNIAQATEHTLSRVRYWVIPSLGTIQNQFWFKRLQKKPASRKVPPKSFPLLSFHEPIEISRVSQSVSESTQALMIIIQDTLEKSSLLPSKIVIEYHLFFQEASLIETFIKKSYPHIALLIQPAHDALSADFGPHIGVAMLL